MKLRGWQSRSDFTILRLVMRTGESIWRRFDDNQVVPILPPPLQKLADTPVLRSEMPAGFHHATVVRLAPDRRIHTLGAVRIDFTNARASESASYALFGTRARASAFARRERAIKTGSLFRVQAAVVGRIVIGVTAKTRAQANALLILSIRHLRRSENS